MNAIAEFVKKTGKKPVLRRRNLQSMHYIRGIVTYSAYKIPQQVGNSILMRLLGLFFYALNLRNSMKWCISLAENRKHTMHYIYKIYGFSA